MPQLTPSNLQFNPFSLENTTDYKNWRDQKLSAYPRDIKSLIVSIKNPYQLTLPEKEKISTLCRQINFALYQIESDTPVEKAAIQTLAAQFGLCRLDHNLGADDEGITALQVVAEKPGQEYIPYTNRPINWHTDGYYNRPEQQIHAVILHCIRQAPDGGENKLLDHEIAYIHLRDHNPGYIAALMSMEVMTIPPNIEGEITLRSAQSGPVFSLEPGSGQLHMRYTARTKSIVWKSDAITKAALKCLTDFCHSDSPYIFEYLLAPNQGLICNNVLHTRNGFTDGESLAQQRLLYRLRFYDRI